MGGGERWLRVCGGAGPDAVAALGAGDYALLALEQRIALLRWLLELVLASEALRAHLDARLEAYCAPHVLLGDVFRGLAGGTGGGSGSGAYGPGGGSAAFALCATAPPEQDRADAAADVERATAGRMLQEWLNWLAQLEQQTCVVLP